MNFWRGAGRWVVATLTVAACLQVSTQTTASAAAPYFTSIAVGGYHTCALDGAGTAYCWGSNSTGQLNDGSFVDKLVPTATVSGYTWKSLTGGGATTCGVRSDDLGYCWGFNMYGQLGNNSTSTSSTPVAISGGYSWRSIAGGSNLTCGVTLADDGYCWGYNTNGPIGDGSTTQRLVPSLVSGGLDWSMIQPAQDHTCGITTSQDLYCWGDGYAGAIGQGDQLDHTTPQQVSAGTQWIKVDTVHGKTCALTAAGAAYCWGENTASTLGDGTAVNPRLSPSAIVGGLTFTDIEIGGSSKCAITAAGIVYCWGYNNYGEPGNGGTSHVTTPTAVVGGITFASVNMQSYSACGLSTTGIAYCWGYNNFGQLGVNSTANSNVPMTVYGMISNSTVSVAVDPSFLFTVATHVGACNGVSQSGSAVTDGTSVALGRIAGGTQATGAQDLSVTTNAGNGFTVFMRASSQMTDGTRSLAVVSGSNGSPTSFPAVGTEGVGYTTSDSSLAGGTANRFTSPSAAWASLSLTDVPVSSATSVPTTDTRCIAYRAGTATTTAAGTYLATIIYTAVPAF